MSSRPTPLAAADVVPCPVALITRAQSPHVDRAVRAGELVRVIRGVYAPRAGWEPLAPWERYLARVHATAVVYPDAVFVRESGAALRGLPVFGEPPHVHAVVPGSVTTRAVDRTRFHGAERTPTHERIGGVLVAAAADLAVDLARLRHPAVGLSVVGAALRADPGLPLGRLRAINESHPSSRGRRRARWVLDRATAVPESTLEHVSLAVIEWLGFPAPELQVWFRGARVGEDDRVDFFWQSLRVVGEADGGIKYSGEMGDAREGLRQRGIRDARLMERGARAVKHWDWHDTVRVTPIRTALLTAGLPLLRPPDHAALHSLRRALHGAP